MFANTPELFWSKVHIRGNNSCWEWIGCKDIKGYGRVKYHRKVVAAHRIAYKLFFGSIPSNMQVLHKCDNRVCCNPSHLYLGTNSDNVRDKVARNRQYRPAGLLNNHVKLSISNISEIRELYKIGKHSYRALAKRFNVTEPNIGYIVRRETWKFVD